MLSGDPDAKIIWQRSRRRLPLNWRVGRLEMLDRSLLYSWKMDGVEETFAAYIAHRKKLQSVLVFTLDDDDVTRTAANGTLVTRHQ